MNGLPPVLNPRQKLPARIASRMRPARKTGHLWARKLKSDQEVETLEGTCVARAGDYLCRGVSNEVWAQSEAKLLGKYIASGIFDNAGWQQYTPHPAAPPVLAASVPRAFRLRSAWGILCGQPGDYVVQSTADTEDMWIVASQVFNETYDFE